MIYINVFFVFFSGYWAYKEFKRGNNRSGWFNLFASAVNLAAVFVYLINQ